ncbi:MAG TPA: nucleotidyltransferase domain-containing protein [Candidatus Binatia bacterium]|nr:nucleotidyltransferase domain-containing protein [Candidatus Binatia bacterium]
MTAPLLDPQITRLLGLLREGLAELYGDRLRGLYLFGSYARGTAGPDSDLDVLVVLEDFSRYGEEVDRTSELVGQLSLAFGVAVSRVFIREREWRNPATTFLANVRDEAVAA